MAMVNMNNLLNGKDSRWLQLEVCREFQRNKCSRPDTECKFAHPPANVEVQNGRVTACYDSIKGRCNREKPPCKYFHPPQHLKDQLLINGRNHLALKNAIMQQMGLTPGQPLVPGQVPTVAANPYLTGMPQVGSTYSPYFAPGPIMPAIMGPDPSVASQLGVVPQTVVAQQKMPRSDRLEVCREFQRGACKRAESECRFAHPADTVTANEDGTVTVCMDSVMGRCNRDPCRYFHPPLHLQAHIKAAQSRASAMDVKSVGSFYYENFAFPGMVPYKRPAADKSGMPVYQPSATTYQQLMQLQQPFVPVSCEYTSPPPSAVVTSLPSVSASSPVTSTITTHHHQEQPKLTAPHIPQQQSQPSQQEVEEPEPARAQSVSTSAVSAASLPPLPPHTVISVHSAPPTPVIHDPAALAKEVAQQNYAKAVKLAAVSNSFGINPLTALSYTGVALNKQTMPMPPPSAVPRYSTLPFNFGGAATPGLNIGMPNPYAAAHQAQAAAAAHAAAAQQQNLFTFSRPPPTLINPYSFLRPYAPSHHPQLLSQGLLAAAGQYQVSAAQSVQLQQAPVVSLAQTNNNNNVVLQPYKKMKTT